MNPLVAVQHGAWLHFDEILRCNTLNEKGIYDCIAHYPLLVDAIKMIDHLVCCHFSSRVYIPDLAATFTELAPLKM